MWNVRRFLAWYLPCLVIGVVIYPLHSSDAASLLVIMMMMGAMGYLLLRANTVNEWTDDVIPFMCGLLSGEYFVRYVIVGGG